jgi:hypothetical protein
LNIQLPAVPGVGPSTNSNDPIVGPTLHPALTHAHGPTGQNFALIIESTEKSSSGASDVWYFVRGLHTNIRPHTLPEKDTPSEKRPSLKEFEHLGCRLCKYVS